MSMTVEEARKFLTNETKKYQLENTNHIENLADLDAKNEKPDSLKFKHEQFRLLFTKKVLIILIALENLLTKKFKVQLNESQSNVVNLIEQLHNYVGEYQKEMKIHEDSAFANTLTAELTKIKQISNNCYEAALKNNINQTRNIKPAPQNLRSVLLDTTPKENTVLHELPKTTRNNTDRLIQPAPPKGKFSYADTIRNIATKMIALHESVRVKTRPNQDDFNKEKQLYSKFEKLEQIMQKSGAIDYQTADSIRKVHDIFKVYVPLSEIPPDAQIDYFSAYLKVFSDISLREKKERLDLSDLVLLNELQSKIIKLYVQIPLPSLTAELENQYRKYRESIKEIKQVNPPKQEEKPSPERPPSWSEYLASVGSSALESVKQVAESLPNMATFAETEQASLKIKREQMLNSIDAFAAVLKNVQSGIIPQEYDQQIKILDCRKKLLNTNNKIELNNNWLELNKAITEFSEMMKTIYYSQALKSLPARVTNMLIDIKYRAALDYVMSARNLGVEISEPDIIANPVEEQHPSDKINENLIYTGLKEKYFILDKIKQNKVAVSNEISELKKSISDSSGSDKQNIEQSLTHLNNKLQVYKAQERFLNLKVVNVQALDIFYEQLVDYTQKLAIIEKENIKEFETINQNIRAIAFRSLGLDPAINRSHVIKPTEHDTKTTQITQKSRQPVTTQIDPELLAKELFAVYKELAEKLQLFNLDLASTNTDYRQITNLFSKLKKLHGNNDKSQEIQKEVDQKIDKIFSELSNDQQTVKMVLQQLGQPNVVNMLINAEAAINKLPEIIEARKNTKNRLIYKNSEELIKEIEALMTKRDQHIETLRKPHVNNQKKPQTNELQIELSKNKQALADLRQKFNRLKKEFGNQDPTDQQSAMSIQSTVKQLENARIKLEEAEKIIAHPRSYTRSEFKNLAPTTWVKPIPLSTRHQNKT